MMSHVMCLVLVAALVSGCGDAAEGEASEGVGATSDASAEAPQDVGATGDVPMEPPHDGAGEEEVTRPPVDPWLTPAEGCDAAIELPADPLVLDGRATPDIPPKANGKPSQLHLTDVIIGQEDGLLYLSGLPALVIMDPSQDVPVTVGSISGRAEHVAWVDSGLVALTSRGNSSKPSSGTQGGGGQGGGQGGGGKGIKEPGVYLVDVSVPTSPSKVGFTALEDAAGLGAHGGYLHVLTHVGELHTFDIAGEGDPVSVHALSGLGNPWAIAFDGQWGYVADNSLGLVVLDMSTPSAPAIVTTVSALGGAQGVALDGASLYLAVGSKGVQAFDLSEPSAPVSLGLTGVAGAAISVSASEGLVWYATQQAIGVLDASDPADLVSLGFEETPSWAMSVAAQGVKGYLADWRYVDAFRVSPEVASPEADFERDECIFVGTTTSMDITLHNRGAGALEIFSAWVDDPRVSVLVDTLTVAPGEDASVRLSFADDGQPLDATLCLSTNDPDGPVQSFPVTSVSSDPNAMVGLPAPDFTLTDLDGVSHQLSKQLGKPVVLSFFATW